MIIYKEIKVELTTDETNALLKARDVIDTLIEQMHANNLICVDTDYDIYDETTLDDLATHLHNLSTVYAGGTNNDLY